MKRLATIFHLPFLLEIGSTNIAMF